MALDTGIGSSSKRREDVRFLTGKGRYTDDLNRPGQAWVHFLRSDVAHGRIRKLDTAAAEAMPGVLKVFTAKDFEGVGGVPCGWLVTDRNGQPMKEPKHPILAEGKVRHVGAQEVHVGLAGAVQVVGVAPLAGQEAHVLAALGGCADAGVECHRPLPTRPRRATSLARRPPPGSP